MENNWRQRLRKLFSWRSLPGLLLTEESISGGTLFKLLWRLLENIHTTLWLLDGLQKSPSLIAPWVVQHPAVVNWSMFIIGILWLSFVVWGDRLFGTRSDSSDSITAEFIQTKMFPSHWVAPLAMDLMVAVGRPNEIFELDVLHEIYVVNQGEEITVKSMRAEAEFEEQPWIKLKQIRDLGDYELMTEKREANRYGGEVINKTYRSLDDFMNKTANGLKNRIGYRGFVRFRVNATKKQAEGGVRTKLWIIDALGNEHGLLSSKGDIEPSEGQITYSRRHLEI
jgi:hypothetical protein